MIHRCNECQFRKIIKQNSVISERNQVWCVHPDKEYIRQYFNDKRLAGAEGFICYTEKYSETLTRKTSPRWCPLKKERGEDGEIK